MEKAHTKRTEAITASSGEKLNHQATEKEKENFPRTQKKNNKENFPLNWTAAENFIQHNVF